MSAPKLLVFSVLTLCVACQIEGDDELHSTRRAIIGGSATTDYPAVAQISMTFESGETFACSSTLISPRVLLTAAHCLEVEDVDSPLASIEAYFGTKRGQDPGHIATIAAADWIWYQPWSLQANDIALVLLAKDAPVEPLPYHTLQLGNGAIGDPLHVVGWGNTSESGGSGTKRHMTTPITGFQSSYVLNYGTASKNTCQGDSGGPGFLSFGGEERVVSVTSWGTGACLGVSGATRVGAYAAWIDDWVSSHDIPEVPSVEITRPANGAEVGAGFQILVEATDDTEITEVEIWINDEKHATLPGDLPPFVISAPVLPDGQATIRAVAYDNRGDAGSQTVTVTVDASCETDDDCDGKLVCGDDNFCESFELSLGEDCGGKGECTSKICAEVGEENRCSQECVPGEMMSCPDGYDCLGVSAELGYCWPAGPAPEEGGCNSGGRSSGAAAVLLLIILGLLARVRAPGRR